MQSELKPCPFCGGEARLWPVIMPFDADCDSITVQCTECNAIGADVLVDQDVHSQSDLADLEAEAIAAWNARASDAEITRLTEALRAAEEREKGLRDALGATESAIAEYYRYWTGGETRGSYDGKPERNALWQTREKARQTLAALKGPNHDA